MLMFTVIKSLSNAINLKLIFVGVWLYSFVVQGIFVPYCYRYHALWHSIGVHCLYDIRSLVQVGTGVKSYQTEDESWVVR